MEKEKILKQIDKYWDMAIKSMHETSPKDKELPTTSGKVEEQLEYLYNKHREHLKEIFALLG